MDTIHIQELKIETLIGCLPWERQLRQPVLFDLKIEFDLRQAGELDALTSTIDYCAIGNTLRQFVEQSEFKLLEALAEQSAALLLKTFPIEKLYLHVTKTAALKNAKAVSMTIERP